MRNKDLKEFARLVGHKNLDKLVDPELFGRKFLTVYRVKTNKEKRMKLAWEWYSFLKYSDFLHKTTRLGIFFGISNKIIEEQLNLTSVRTIIYRDILELDDKLGFNFIDKLVDGVIKDEDFDYIESMKIEYNFYKNISEQTDNFKNQFSLNFNEGVFSRAFNQTISDEEFEDFIKLFKIFSIPYQEYIRENLDDEYIGYVEYLLSTNDDRLSEIDRMRKEFMIISLKLNTDTYRGE